MTSSNQEELQPAASSATDLSPMGGPPPVVSNLSSRGSSSSLATDMLPVGMAEADPLLLSPACCLVTLRLRVWGALDINWDDEQWLLEHGRVRAYDACPEDDDFLAMEHPDLLEQH